MTRPRHDPTRLRRRAFAASSGLHAAGIAGALVLAGAAAPEVAWSFTQSMPSRSSLRAEHLEPPDAARQPEPPRVQPEPSPSVELPPAPEPLPQTQPLEPGPEPFDPRPSVAPPRLAPDLDLLARLVPPPAAPEPTTDPSPSPAEPEAATPSPEGAVVQPSPLTGHNEPPAYPFPAWRRGIEGTVVVLLEIDADGDVTAAHVEQSSGSSALDDAALQQLSRWRFAPAQREGIPVRGSWRQIVEFRLRTD